MTQNSSEIQVIHDQLLLQGVIEAESYVNEKNAAALAEKALFEVSPTAVTLVLSFKRIGIYQHAFSNSFTITVTIIIYMVIIFSGCIENIIGFDKLTKLCLDNNFIEEIKNLDFLVSLKWLDLSFNKIRKIEGNI